MGFIYKAAQCQSRLEMIQLNTIDKICSESHFIQVSVSSSIGSLDLLMGEVDVPLLVEKQMIKW